MSIAGSSITASFGLNGGVDMTALASQLADAQFALKSDRLAERSQVLERRISLAGSIRSSLLQLAGALGDRLRAGDLAAKPSISNAAVADVAPSAGRAIGGPFALEVLALASRQTLAGPPFADAATAVGGGRLTIRFGTHDDGAFALHPDHQPLDIDVPAGASLADIAQAITGSAGGMTAYVARTEAGAQLVIKGPEGQANGFIVEVTEDPAAPGLAALAWQADGDQARLLGIAADARYRLDGLDRRSSGNSVADAAPGLSLILKAPNPGAPATIRFGDAVPQVAGVLQDMIAALNEIVGTLREATDAKTGELARDSGARALARSLSGLGTVEIMPGAPPGAPRTLAELGLAIGRDGGFRLDSARLDAALARDPQGVMAMFTTGVHGIYASIDRLARTGTSSGDPSSLGGSIARYQAQMQKNAAALATLAEDREALRATMISRFARVDTRVAASRSTLSFLQSQIEVWNAQSR